MAEPLLARTSGDRPLQVLHLIKGLGPGGAEQLLVQQARCRDRDRFDYRVAYVLAHKDHLVAELEAAGVTTICLDPEGRGHWARTLHDLLREQQPDVVHCHSPVLAVAARTLTRTVSLAADGPRPRIMTTEHNRWPRHHRLTRLANRATLRLDDSTVAVSDDVARSMPVTLRPPTLVHGIDLEAVRTRRHHRAEIRHELGLPADAIVVGTVANLRPEKGYDVLLDAAAEVVDRDERVTFLIVGQGPLEAEVAAHHRRLGLGARVRLLGYRSDATTVMAGCDLFAMASRHEGLPVALMEALALGLPVVATEAGGIPQAVTDGAEARLVPVDDPAALADALVEVCRDPERRERMADAALERATAFDVNRSTAWLENHYRGLQPVG